jgi:hypothetical protein
MTTLITSHPVTDEQKDQLAGLASDAIKNILRNLPLDSASAKRVAFRFDEVAQAMSAKVAEILFSPAFMTSSPTRAREIMGQNFLGPQEVTKHYGVAYRLEQLTPLALIPFSEATLYECKDTHILVAGYPMTILDIVVKAPKDTKSFASYGDAWYNHELFVENEHVNLRWYLIRKDVVEGSVKNVIKASASSFDKRKALLSKNEEVPRACEFTYAIVLYFLATGERLFPDIYAHCIDLDSGGVSVRVGYFGPNGLCIGGGYVTYSDHLVGMASSRKHDC